jgi:uncharacterized iron-regulated membrane protein
MKTTFRKSMIWLHTYTGLFAGWLIFAVFLTGTLSYYNQEITHWMTQGQVAKHPQSTLINHALTRLNEAAPNAKSWRIQLPDERGSAFQISYRQEGEGRRGGTRLYLNPDDLTVKEEPQTRGGNFFRRFHYTLSLGDWGGRYFTGIAAMMMLIAVFTGIYTHRRFFKDFFTLRNKDKLKFTIDFHAISGIITIPFCFVICFSALAIYISMYQPFAINHYYDSFRDLDRQVSTRHNNLEPSGTQLGLITNIDHLMPALNQEWGNNPELSSISVNNPSDKNAQVIVYKQKNDIVSNKAQSLAFLKTGEPLAKIEDERLPRMVRRVFYGLHEAHFATPLPRAMLFLLGMFSTILISTGIFIWLRKRQQRQHKPVYTWLEKTNNGVIYGLTLATAAYFLCSKLPITSVNLAAMELPVFFYTWLVSLLFCLVTPTDKAKSLLLLANGIAFLVLIILDAETLVQGQTSAFELPSLTMSFWVLLTTVYFVRAFFKTRLLTNKTMRKSYA